MLLDRFYPDLYVNSVYDIPFDSLLTQGRNALIFDVDNTLAPFDIPDPPVEISDMFAMLKKKGFSLCLVSNNRQARIDIFNRPLNIHGISNARKPSTAAVKRAMRAMGSDKTNTVFIGDQVFTDVWCGNRAGVMTILVKPISIRDEWTVKLKRGIESQVIKAYLKTKA